MNVYEMEGFLRGKCIPRDILVNESTAAYLVRKLNESATLKADRDAQQKRADALAVENAAQGAALSLISGCYGLSPHIQSMCAVETPATSVALAAIEARVWAEAKYFAKSMLASDSADCIDFLFDGKIQQLREAK